MKADGPIEREADAIERHDAANLRQELRERYAGEGGDELRDLLFAICRPSCSLIGHERKAGKDYCRFCGWILGEEACAPDLSPIDVEQKP